MSVYFVQDGGPGGHIKIGYTAGNPHARIATFRTGNPRPLTLLVVIPGEPAEERALHERFNDLRESGEWFRPDERLLGFIEGMTFRYPKQPKDPGAVAPSYGFDHDQLSFIRGFIMRIIAEQGAVDVVRRVGGVDTYFGAYELGDSAACFSVEKTDMSLWFQADDADAKLSELMDLVLIHEPGSSFSRGVSALGVTPLRYYSELLCLIQSQIQKANGGTT